MVALNRKLPEVSVKIERKIGFVSIRTSIVSIIIQHTNLNFIYFKVSWWSKYDEPDSHFNPTNMVLE